MVRSALYAREQSKSSVRTSSSHTHHQRDWSRCMERGGQEGGIMSISFEDFLADLR